MTTTRYGKDKYDTVDVPVWWKPEGSGMMYNRFGLPSSHPESAYRYIKDVLKRRPEDFDVMPDEEDVCPHCSRPFDREF